MFPKKPADFFIAEPLGDLLFLSPPEAVYYLAYKSDHSGYPIAVSIKRLENPNFLKAMDGYFYNGKYHISFKMGEGITLHGSEFDKMWGFDKNKLKAYAQSSDGLCYSGPIKDEEEELE